MISDKSSLLGSLDMDLWRVWMIWLGLILLVFETTTIILLVESYLSYFRSRLPAVPCVFAP